VPGDNRRSVSACRLPDEVTACLAELEAALAQLPHAAPHLARLRRHYVPGAGYAAAFAGVLAALFAHEGLVLLDPRDPALAHATLPIHERALSQHTTIAAALAERSSQLTAAGYASTVQLRGDAALSFFHALGPSGPRARPELRPEGFFDRTTARSYSLAELLAALRAEPACFSTSALLRPILQDSLLPVAAYVGGPAEVAYFAQLAPLYAAYDMTPPLVVPRARLRVVDDKARRALARLGLSSAELAHGEASALARAAQHDPGSTGPELARRLSLRLEAGLDEVLATLGELAPEVRRSADKTRATLGKSAAKLARKYEHTGLRRDAARVTDVQRLLAYLYPDGQPQERGFGVSAFAARYGEREFLASILATIQPFDPTPREVFP
jgi:bacillithiol synthase